MIKRIVKTAPKCTIATVLLFSQIQAHADWTTPCGFSQCDTSDGNGGFWIDADYLYWKIQNSKESSPLVIEGPTLAVPPPVLGSPGTTVVLGGREIDTDWRSGGKIALGMWLNNSCDYGVEVSYSILPNESKTYAVSSNGTPTSPFLLAPFYNVLTSAEDSTAIASPLLGFEGTATLKLTNMVQGAEANILTNIPSCDCRSTFVGLVGFRYWNFKERLTFSTDSPYIPPHTQDVYTTHDQFKVDNNFYGGQLGLIWECDWDCLYVSAKGKVALGAMQEQVNINGFLTTNDYSGFGVVSEYAGGYFALPTNIGKHSRTKFAAIPEINLEAGCRLFDHFELRLGYTFMYVSNVLWAGKQIDRNINPTQATTYTNALPPLLDGEASPKARLRNAGLWAQGLNVGIEISF